MEFINIRKVAIVAVVGIALGGMGRAVASPIQTTMTYTTTGTVGTTGVTGTGSVSFQGVEFGILDTGVHFNFGSFVVAPSANDSVTTYVDTPFSIAFKVLDVNGENPTVNDTPVVLKGLLNGTASASLAASNLSVYFYAQPVPIDQGFPYSASTDPFRIGDQMGYLSLNNVQLGGAPIQAELNTVQSVPEPSAIAIFASAVAFLAIQRRSRGISLAASN